MKPKSKVSNASLAATITVFALGAAAIAGLMTSRTVDATALPIERPDGNGAVRCSVRTITGSWVFVTVGNQELGGLWVPWTAAGTINIDALGHVSGTIDGNTPFGVFPDDPYAGEVTVNGDCRGRLNITSNAGANATFSIVISGHGKEFSGMSLVTGDVSTFTAKRTSGQF